MHSMACLRDREAPSLALCWTAVITSARRWGRNFSRCNAANLSVLSARKWPSVGTWERRLAANSQFSQGLGSCRDIFMMDMHVDVHIGKRTQHATRVIAFDQAQFGKHLHIFVHALDIAANSSRQFSHR